MGGSDPDNVTLKVINAIKRLDDSDLKIKVIVGSSNPHVLDIKNAMLPAPCSMLGIENAANMPELMIWADVAISAGGSTCWEMAFKGLPAILIITGDNQKGIASGLDEIGVANSLGWFSEVSVLNISRSLNCICQDHRMREIMSLQGNKLIDGNGTSRVINVMKDVAN
jgi:spore coat polysaccharide biosynthesis predicted glycosyltransferase SpsG